MRYSLLAAVSAVALLSTGAAWAQSAADARLGDDIRGRLEDGDARTRGSDGYRYDDYRVNLRAGQPYAISAVYGYGYRLDVPDEALQAAPQTP